MTVQRLLATAALVLALAAAGCGNGGDDGANDNEAAPERDSDPPSSTTASRSGGSTASCPLTEAQVGEVLGVAVEAKGCSFYPASGDAAPNASYNRQYDVVFTAEGREQEGYDTEVDGIGDEALTKHQADGTWLAVKAGARIFEIRVDTLDQSRNLEAAKQLAQLVLAG